MIPCFMVEPIFDEPGTLSDAHYDHWNPEQRGILRFRRTDTGEEKESLQEFGVGAMWRALWMRRGYIWTNETEPHLIVTTPGGDWDIDSRCSNCTLPEDTTHRCWVRHGEPPNITVDKNGVTCAAGAGSFAPKSGKWHGFLREGHLTT